MEDAAVWCTISSTKASCVLLRASGSAVQWTAVGLGAKVGTLGYDGGNAREGTLLVVVEAVEVTDISSGGRTIFPDGLKGPGFIRT